MARRYTAIIPQTFDDILQQNISKTDRINGCGVIVIRDDKILVGTRLDGKYSGQICGPGGHIEAGETPEEAAKRETFEEFGIECLELESLGILDGGRAYGKSAVFLCYAFDGEPETDEEEMTGIRWLSIEELSEEKLFRPFEQSIDLLKDDKIAKSFDAVLKFNRNHDPLTGRFTSGPGGPMMAPDKGGGGGGSSSKDSGGDYSNMIRQGPPPKKTKIAYKVFCVKNGKLYPPMVANPGAQDTPMGVWLDASEGERAGESKTGRPQVKAGGKGTKGGGGKLAYRPGWHLGEVPKADQFYTRNKKTGQKEQYKNFVWAECEIAADIDYQDEAMSYGYTANGKFRHSYAGLPRLPKDGCYKYRTNPDPNTKPWYITGSMKVNRILSDAETDAILRAHGETPMPRQGGPLDLEALGIKKSADITPQKEDSEMAENPQNFNIFKTDEDKRLVFGWASVAKTADGEVVIDHEKDIIDPEDMEETAYAYVLDFRDTGEEHISTMRKKGRLVESVVFTKEKMQAMGIPEGIVPEGWWVGFKIDDDSAWEKVKNGTYRMFSIEGTAAREVVDVAKTFYDIMKYNHNHDPATGRFTSGPGGAGGGSSSGSRNYGRTDTSDAREQISGGSSNSLEAHMDADGNLTPEREAVHKQIIDNWLKGKRPAEGQATMTMMGGGPASGKSSAIENGFVQLPDQDTLVTVDPDFFKTQLPGYAEMAAKDSTAAGFYHEESSALAKRAYAVALSENINVLYDGTGDGSFRSASKKIQQAKDAGYKVKGEYVTIDTAEALRRNQKRYDDAKAKYDAGESSTPPRLPDKNVVIGTHSKVTNIAIACASQFDSINIYDNNGPKGSTKLIATGGNGKGLVATDKEAFNRFLAKGSGDFITLPDGQVVPAE